MSEELKLLKEQNRGLIEENRLLRLEIKNLNSINQSLEAKIKARDFIIEENNKLIKELKKKLADLQNDHEEFKQSICYFLETTLNVDTSALKHLLKIKE